MRLAWAPLALLLPLALSGCPDVNVDPDETTPVAEGPLVEFDPGNKIVPFPNNLLLDRATGKVSLPAQCNESDTQTALRTMVLNTLDGFGTFKPALQFTLTEPVDPASLDGNVLLYKRATRGMAVDASMAMPVPVVVIPSMTARASADCTSTAPVDSVIVVPRVPLDQSSTYVVAVTTGLMTASGQPFGPSFTWAMVRQSEDPVTIDANDEIVVNHTPLDPRDPADDALLRGLDLLWKAHAQALAFLDAATATARTDLLLAWEFNTQTVIDPLDPSVTDSPASQVPGAPIAGPQGSPIPVSVIPAGVTPTQYLTGAGLPCAALGGACDTVGDVLAGVLVSPSFQVDTPNPLAGSPVIPGPWSDPLHPAKVSDAGIGVLIVVPNAAVIPKPATGWPTIVFGHGLGSNKNTLLAIAPQLASQGFATVAIDFVAHGTRAVRNSDATGLGCSGTPTTTSAPQCFAPFLSPNLAATRDNIRQTVVDHLSLIASLQACATTACGALDPDADKLGYAGISLGGIIGALIATVSSELQGAVLNVAGAGLIDIVENTETPAIKCGLVDALIDAGVITGAKFDPMAMTGICLTDDWKTQPSYLTFSNIARWVLDPADGANFAARLGGRTFLLQEVIDDAVVPNVATEQLGQLSGLMPETGAPATSPPPFNPSAAIIGPTTVWVQYPTLPADAGTGFPGNTFVHSSLLRPANDGNDGRLGTARLQVDAIAFLVLHVEN